MLDPAAWIQDPETLIATDAEVKGRWGTPHDQRLGEDGETHIVKLGFGWMGERHTTDTGVRWVEASDVTEAGVEEGSGGR